MPTTSTPPNAFSPPPFQATIVQDVAVIIDRYPDIGNRITQTCGREEMHTYLNSILFDERGGRQGFPEAVITALFRVYEADRRLVPKAS
jgi:hypothetical protein